MNSRTLRELKKRIPSSTRDRIGGLIEAAYDRMQADNRMQAGKSDFWTGQKPRRNAYSQYLDKAMPRLQNHLKEPF